jgi:hypothetical protein
MLLEHYFRFRGNSRRRVELSELTVQLWPSWEEPLLCARYPKLKEQDKQDRR